MMAIFPCCVFLETVSDEKAPSLFTGNTFPKLQRGRWIVDVIFRGQSLTTSQHVRTLTATRCASECIHSCNCNLDETLSTLARRMEAGLSDEQGDHLISLLEQRPCLFNLKLKSYFNRDIKRKALEKIVKSLSITGKHNSLTFTKYCYKACPH